MLMLPMKNCKLHKNAITSLSKGNPAELPVHQRIRHARLTAGLSSTELAATVGVGNDVISRYENNHITMQGMDIELLKKIAVACNRDKHFCCDDYHIFKDNFADYILKHMKANALTNQALSELCGVSVQTVKQWKRRRCSPKYELWEKIFKDYKK